MNDNFCDFCPLCGSSFYGDTPEEVMEKMVEHVDSGYCKGHFLTPGEALQIDRIEKAKGKVW